jgi:hypothetical protein
MTEDYRQGSFCWDYSRFLPETIAETQEIASLFVFNKPWKSAKLYNFETH